MLLFPFSYVFLARLYETEYLYFFWDFFYIITISPFLLHFSFWSTCSSSFNFCFPLSPFCSYSVYSACFRNLSVFLCYFLISFLACSVNFLLLPSLFVLSTFACLKGVLLEWRIVIIKEGREITQFRFNNSFQVLVVCKNKALYEREYLRLQWNFRLQQIWIKSIYTNPLLSSSSSDWWGVKNILNY